MAEGDIFLDVDTELPEPSGSRQKLLTPAEIASMVGTVNELANAILIEISDPGPLQGNGDPGNPVVVWQGEAPGMFERARKETAAADREHQGKTDTFQIYDAVAPPYEFAAADWGASTVVIRDESRPTPVTSRWTIKGTVKETEGTLDRITLELEGETAP